MFFDPPLPKKPELIVIGDLHLDTSSSWRTPLLEKTITEIGKINPHTAIFAGDVFEHNNRLDADTFTLFASALLTLKTEKVFWITGQHDSCRQGVPTLPLLDNLTDFLSIISDKPKVITIPINRQDKKFVLVPYNRDTTQYKKWLKIITGKYKYIITHMPTNEALPTPARSDNYISINDFGNLFAISGDIHNSCVLVNSKKGRIVYTGIPVQRDWRDAGARGGVITINKGKTTRHKSYAVNHRHFRIGDLDLNKKLTLPPYLLHRIRVDCANDQEMKKARKLFSGIDNVELSLCDVSWASTQKDNANKTLIKDDNSVVETYAKENTTKQNRKIVIATGRRIINEIDQD